jgi:hypothetical protein
MCRTLFSVFVVTTVLSVCGCGSGLGDGKATLKEHEAVIREAVKLKREFADVLESVKDPASAKAAIEKINAISIKRVELSQKKETLPYIHPDERQRLLEKVQKDVDNLNERILTAMPTLRDKAGPHAAALESSAEHFQNIRPVPPVLDE